VEACSKEDKINDFGRDPIGEGEEERVSLPSNTFNETEMIDLFVISLYAAQIRNTIATLEPR
jgi:hypothetical protein